MEIEKIDKDFELPEISDLEELEWFDVRESPFAVYGVSYDEDAGEFRRISVRDSERMRASVRELASNTAGGRVRFVSDSPYIAVAYLTESNGILNRFTIAGNYGFSLYSDGVFKGIIAPKGHDLMVPVGDAVKFSGYRPIAEAGEHETELFMPLYARVRSLYVGLRKGSALKPARAYMYPKPVVFYGSSITQGGCASRPGTDYISLLSRMLDTDVLNLGFSGNAKGEIEMAEYLASLDPSVYVIDYDHNAPSVEHLNNTHYRLYRALRAAHERTPIILLSRPDFESGEDSEGLRRVVHHTYERAVAQGDRYVEFIDGETLFGAEEREICTVDTRHPNDVGFYRMAKRIAPVLKEQLKK